MKLLYRRLKEISMVFLLLFVTGCDLLPLNDSPPSYIKQVTAYKEGSDGFMIYIVLADANGAMTTCDGDLTLEIVEIKNNYELYRGITKTKRVLYSATRSISKKEFIKTKVGMGAFEHEVIMYPVGRISYQKFVDIPTEMTGDLVVSFKTKDGLELTGKDALFF